ncbi:YkoF-like protein [Favolaschia claudopus]|uniref:YkoF-like protein n=1 Tax=Favolaschia claudopus TaxID=2862362 RepID=A0AAW0CGV1_9AGAR
MTDANSDELYAVADFCLIPMGTGAVSVAAEIAECQRILSKSGLTYKGPWSAVSKAIHDCHAAVHAHGAPRIATDIRIGTRVDRETAPGTGNDHKVRRVQEILQQDNAA